MSLPSEGTNRMDKFSRCVICQSKDHADILVQIPATDSWENLLHLLHERGIYLDGKC